jgi:hypothetical protein
VGVRAEEGQHNVALASASVLVPPSAFVGDEREEAGSSGGNTVTPAEQIAKMTKAINQAIKLMSDRFGSTEGDVARAIQDLKASLQPSA